MPTDFKKVLIACFFALPSFAFAADNAAEVKSPVPAEASVSVTTEPSPKPAQAAQVSRIGHVDIGRIGTDSERGKTLRALLSSKKDTLQGIIDGKKKPIEKLRASIEAKFATMTPKQREAKSKEFQKKLEEFQKFAQESERDFYTLQDKETGALYEAIERSAAALGTAGGFAAIVIKKELLYVSRSVDVQDVTDALIKELNLADQKK